MSSIQMSAEELYKKCCAYLLWKEIAWRYEQAMFVKRLTKRKSWFRWKTYSYQNAFELIENDLAKDRWNLYLLGYIYKGNSDRISKVKQLILLCKNGDPVTVTTEDSFVLEEVFTKELNAMGITIDKAVEICESDKRGLS